MEIALRPAVADDFAELSTIAHEGGSDDSGSGYLAFVVEFGQLLCGVNNDEVVAFGGTLPIGDDMMVTDLFVSPNARGKGIGGRLLHTLLAGYPQRLTFSSQHPAALAAYRAARMKPTDRLLYLTGSATGGGDPLQAMTPEQWTRGRRELIAHFASEGALITETVVVAVDSDEANVLRLVSEDAVDALGVVLRSLPSKMRVNLCVLESHPLAKWLLSNGFVVRDFDHFCCSDGIELSTELAALHPGLC